MRAEDIALTIDGAVEYLRRALPEADRMSAGDALLKDFARHALSLREETPWGQMIPADIFLPFVLFPRVNNEDLVFCQDQLYAAIAPRLKGLNMADAALEVNHWCFGQATYRSTDGRTANALTVIRRGFGRCGEESTLLVTALRACGLPARQIYVPWWSHCDDNHAWVEVWVDGQWHYMGACEPEPVLDSGWFTAAASKAMLVHTRSYGLLPRGERAENQYGEAWVINRTAAYAKTRLATVTVTDGGRGVPGALVSFELVNSGDFRSICQKRTDADGRADLLTGLGTLHIWVSDGERGASAMLDVSTEDGVIVDLSRGGVPDGACVPFRQRPPRESRIQPTDIPEERLAAHEAKMAQEAALRMARLDALKSGDALLDAAVGNRGVIERFLSEANGDADARIALLKSLREKDLVDVTAEVLDDALTGAMPFERRYPRDVWAESVLCPRADDEMLRPCRARLAAVELPEDTAEAAWAYVDAHVSAVDLEPPRLLPDLCDALRCGRGNEKTRDVLFVALARAHGCAVRLHPVTGQKQVWRDGAYRPVLSSSDRASATLVLENASGATLDGGARYGLSRLVCPEGDAGGCAWRPMDVFDLPLPAGQRRSFELEPGQWRVTTVTRQIDGSADARSWYVALQPGETREVTLTAAPDDAEGRLLRAQLPPLPVRLADGSEAVLPVDGAPSIIASVAPGQEPTEHFFNELLEAQDALKAAGIAVWLLLERPEWQGEAKLNRVLETLSCARLGFLKGPAGLTKWREQLNAGELRLPLAAAVGPDGRGRFAFVNYHVGSVRSLISILER